MTQRALTGGVTPLGDGFGGGIKLPVVGGVFVGRGGVGGGATKLPEVGGGVATPAPGFLPLIAVQGIRARRTVGPTV